MIYSKEQVAGLTFVRVKPESEWNENDSGGEAQAKF